MFPIWMAMIAVTSQLDGTVDSLNGKHLNAISGYRSFIFVFSNTISSIISMLFLNQRTD